MAETSRPKTVNFLIDSKLENVPLAGIAVRGICKSLSLNEIDTYYLELCVVEAVNNAIKHAYNSEDGHAVEISITYSDREIVFNISDRGRKMNLYLPGFLDFDPGELDRLPEHGMGLYIINSIIDEVVYRTDDNKNTLTMRKFLHYKN